MDVDGVGEIDMTLRFDEIGYWSEIKLDIVRKYASAYSTILSKQEWVRGYYYIDAFAGPGMHISKRTSDFVPGSPLNALNVEPPFTGYHFIDLNCEKVDLLREPTADREDVKVHEGDCNGILLQDVFPGVRRQACERALCLLDPYGLHLDWEVVYTAGQSRAIEVFLNFQVFDMNPSTPECIFAWNRWYGGESCDIGIGTNGTGTHPDWTFMVNGASLTPKVGRIWVK